MCSSANEVIDALKNFDIKGLAKDVLPIKLHMGEPGNKNFVSPSFVREVVRYVRGMGIRPVLWDTTVAYRSPRATKEGYLDVARMHGFADICDVYIEDEGYSVEVQGYRFEVAKILQPLDFFMTISHVKGHIQAGFGGAIKNLGMGGVTKESKKKIHEWAKPVYYGIKCVLCGECEKACPFGAIRVDRAWSYSPRKCFGCGLCVEACPEGALKYLRENFLKGLAMSATAVMKGRRSVFVNVLINISAHCDCDPDGGPIICKDLGYLVSDDPVAIDSASLDLIYKNCGRVFEKVNKINPDPILDYAEKLGLGTKEYDLIRYDK
mgnify:CR=1 FL=1